MRPALEALASQQQMINEQRQMITHLTTQAQRQQGSIDYLARGLQAMAQMAGIEGKVASAMLRTADVQNPAQPVPEPPAGPPTQTTPEAETPEAMANVQDPGLVPGSTNDVAADATTTVYTPGMDIPGPAFKNLIDVTQPVDGTQNPRPLQETRTLTDVRVGDPMNPQTAFPLRGDFQNAQRTSSKNDATAASRRTMAALRLAGLQIEAKMVEHDSPYAVAAEIEKSAKSIEVIEAEIRALDGVKTAASKRRAGKGNLVPHSASRKPQPSMQGTPHTAGLTTTAASDDSDLFDP